MNHESKDGLSAVKQRSNSVESDGEDEEIKGKTDTIRHASDPQLSRFD